MLPREFLDKYTQLWYLALGPTVRSSMSGNERDGDLGIAKTQTRVKGEVPGAEARGSGKRTRGAFTIKNELAFQLKDRLDKKLRRIGRELRIELADIEARLNTAYNLSAGIGTGGDTQANSDTHGETRGNPACTKCGRFGVRGWRFCPHDGNVMILK